MDLLLGRLIDVNQIIGRLEPEKFAEQLREPLTRAVTEVRTDLMTRHQPRLWELLPDEVRRRLLRRIADQAPRTVAERTADIASNPGSYLDVWDLALRNLIADRSALNRLFRDIGAPEFRFIARSGVPGSGSPVGGAFRAGRCAGVCRTGDQRDER